MARAKADHGAGSPRTCIIQPRIGLITETFIEAHRRRLPNVVMRLDCDPFPIADEDGRPLMCLLHPLTHRALGRLCGLSRRRADIALARRVPTGLREKALAHRLRAERVDVVLAEYGPTGVAVQDVVARAGVPLVVHFHGYDAYRRTGLERYGSQYTRLFDQAAAIVVVSRHMRDQLINLGAPPSKIEYNPYGIDVREFCEGRPHEMPPVFLAVGRFVEKKAPDLTIRAFARLAAEYPEARLIMIGDGLLKPRCVELVRAFGLDDRVHLLGPRSHAEVAEAMRGVRCFVQHSVTAETGDMEGTPLAILEAMASGLPVVSTRHAGIVDAVREGETGFLVAERDEEGMAKSMACLASKPDLAARFGTAGRRVIISEFSMEDRIGRLERILQQAARSVRDPSGSIPSVRQAT